MPDLPEIPPELRDEVWAALLDLGAHESMRSDFDHHWPACHEYRFQGHLGYGGKIWGEHRRGCWRFWVNCYREDLNQILERRIDASNALLREIAKKVNDA